MRHQSFTDSDRATPSGQPALVASPSSPRAVSTEGFDQAQGDYPAWISTPWGPEYHPGTLLEMVDEAEVSIISLSNEVDYLATLPAYRLASNADLIVETRDRLNNILARLG